MANGIVITIMLLIIQMNQSIAYAAITRYINANVSSEYVYDSNIYKEKQAHDADSIMFLKPTLRLKLPIKNVIFSTSYDAQLAQHAVRNTEDYLNQNLEVDFSYDKASKWQTNSGVGYRKYTELRGETGSTLSPEDVPSGIASRYGFLSLRYMSAATATDYEFRFARTLTRYDNVELNSANTDVNDFKIIGSYFFSVKTSFFLATGFSNVKYVELSESPNKDSTKTSIGLGVKWLSSGKTESHLELGYLRKKYSDFPVDDFIGLYTDINITYFRKSYSKFQLNMRRNTQEGENTNILYYVNNSVKLSFFHQFTKQWQTVISTAAAINQKFDQDNDFIYIVEPSVSYNTSKWFTIGSGIRWQSKKSVIDSSENFNAYTLRLSLGVVMR